MNPERLNVYEACDKAIKQMDREALEDFGKMKMAKWDRVNVIRTVVTVYRKSEKEARKRYYGIAFEAYLLGLYMCGVNGREAHEMAEKAITNEWVDRVLSETDFVTLYRFDTEAERKAYRLAETLEATEDRNREIDKALKAWSKQLAQYAINFTDYAIIQAFSDAGVEEVEWVTTKDEKVCHSCNALDGQVFPVDEIPRKPHWGCRCLMEPILDGASRLK